VSHVEGGGEGVELKSRKEGPVVSGMSLVYLMPFAPLMMNGDSKDPTPGKGPSELVLGLISWMDTASNPPPDSLRLEKGVVDKGAVVPKSTPMEYDETF
jgi:hypothetical protein